MKGLIVGCVIVAIGLFASRGNCNDYFNSLPPHASLPSDSACTAKISPSRERRPENAQYNSKAAIPPAWQLQGVHTSPFYGANPVPASDFARVDGNYSGTTAMILRWAACKWGVEENIVRAQAVLESHWHQTDRNDWRTSKSQCQRGSWYGWTGTGCYQTWGILMIKLYNFNAAPMAINGTAFNADFRMAYQRACMNGDVADLRKDTPVKGYPRYPQNDTNTMVSGCMGQWLTGHWYDSNAIGYIGRLRAVIANPTWLNW
ncbi:MAG TPA: hypothetical protein VMT64_09445 [Candidatus Binataceae bacterium]|nr:hypothetical protein [Candidatus Binataceae bacterium]